MPPKINPNSYLQKLTRKFEGVGVSESKSMSFEFSSDDERKYKHLMFRSTLRLCEPKLGMKFRTKMNLDDGSLVVTRYL